MTQAPRPIIQLEGVRKSYGFAPVLSDLTLAVARGEFVALLGSNGSGKTTLLRLIAGLARPSAGVIRVGGWLIPEEVEQVRPHIGMVSHKSLLYPTLTALENLAFFARLYGRPSSPTDLLPLLERVGLKRRAHSLVRTFSRGMLQRLSIARALLNDPSVLLFDEPYTGLDQEASATLDGLLRAAHDEGRTILMTTHHLERVPLLAQRVIVLHRGQIALDAPADMPSAALVAQYVAITGEAAQP
ncbi:MAG: heme ABC exporter ATP-binding protein CcmA [Anaerolineae bacterium]